MSQPFRASQFEVEKPLSQLSTFGIGGPARFFVEVQKTEELQAILSYCHTQKLPYFILGKGSNSLFDDRGFDGLVILNKIAFCQFDWPLVHVGAGYSFSLIGSQTARKGWAGLEFASGIPGSVGGAVYMNAGASGVETCETLIEVTFVNEKGELEVFKRDQLDFSYRSSPFQKRKGAIASAKFLLHPSEEARKKQLGIIEYRTRTQPYSDKSAGCVFRNPESHSAGALIQQCGLKGKRIGGAEVSTMHANFIVNKDRASSKDILELAAFVKQTVKEKTGVDLEMEIRCVPYQMRDNVSG
ncbi:MAG: UDP-N-acetylmuramate dehydrogenase [Verrucomicrobia bacterium]|nr:UDP-N-acetylmuramate dehydrogenase [Verrucomicrobiota bacterium]